MASAKVSAEDKIKFAMTILTTIVNDAAVPRNIRRAAATALTYLRDTRLSPGVRAANAIGALDEVSQDPNMPLHARTKIWQVLSMLETIKD
ncbi:MAG: Uncharacterized protein conserved in archaea [uncultured Acidilobus sp. CIS]|jgi:Uncharacterized protein conserved in archaea|nr:MAG: Uncharacterized protein conserved in archaea [uncultured Acidilobus sp. CIS]ESQ23907.1 MAG: Uncharacterized protein conserved in archaea [uncultured Acidilobus sp. OSP8]MCG2873540.1 UPF0147 family protein [Acidilobus sp.]MCG2874849.1 UPF0147 family protein [Acidilobus sp.]MCG2881591.1 UPF0147 family protein [Acidilobus sp.]